MPTKAEMSALAEKELAALEAEKDSKFELSVVTTGTDTSTQTNKIMTKDQVLISLTERLLRVQADLKAPKGQLNSFGKYKYRSCEDILEAVKPLLVREGLTLSLSDDIVPIGDRVYVKATATVRLDALNYGDTHTVTAFAREENEKKGMDGAQVTGAASSYARKYALNGLFLIDDSRDSDTDEYAEQTKGIEIKSPQPGGNIGKSFGNNFGSKPNF